LYDLCFLHDVNCKQHSSILQSRFSGYETVCEDLETLISTCPPPFLYIQDVESVKTTVAVIDALLRDISSTSRSPRICHARVDAIACFSSRLIYESIIHSLVGWSPSWEEGCSNWCAENDLRWNENLDTFLHGLQAGHSHLHRQNGKGKQREEGLDAVRIVVVVEHAERLKDTHPELIVPLTRLAELVSPLHHAHLISTDNGFKTKLDLSVIFVSQVGWEDIRPPLGASPDPYYIDIQSPSKESTLCSPLNSLRLKAFTADIVTNLISNFSTFSNPSDDINPYHPALLSLYSQFITLLCDVCFPFTHNLQELQYLAAARWPGFVKPLIDDFKQTREENMEMDDADAEVEAMLLEFTPPSEDLRIRLIRFFNPSLTTALEALLPRQTNAADWARANEPPANLLSMPRTYQAQHTAPPSQADMRSLPRMSKFILIASFLASTNPAKSDLRMFGRGLDEKKRKRRATARTAAKSKSGGPAKVITSSFVACEV